LRKQRILMIGPLPPQIGGMETFIGDLLKSKLIEDYRVFSLNISKLLIKKQSRFKAPMGYAGSFARNPIVSLTSYTLSILFFCRYFFLLLIRWPKLIHIHTASYTSFWEKCLYILIAKALRKKVVLHVHGAMFSTFYGHSSRLVKVLIRGALSMCDRVLVLSRAWADFFSSLLPAGKLYVAPNGIELTRYENSAAEKTELPSVLYLGEVGRRKGVYDLIQAAKKVKDRGHTCNFIIAGSGEIDEAKEFAYQLEVDSICDFPGPQIGQNKIDLLMKSWILALPSYAEGMPIVVLEAFASGLPVVSTNVGGIPDMICDGQNGFLGQPGDVAALANNIIRLLSDQPLRERISQTNKTKAIEQYSISACAEKIGKVYEELLGN